MIVNELSFLSVENGQEEFNSIMSQFLSVCLKIKAKKKDNDFYYTQELFLEEFAPGYTIYGWLNNPHVSRKEKDLFRKMTYKHQVLDKSQFLGSEFLIELPDGRSRSAIGCLAAYEAEGYVVSMQTDSLWKQEEIQGIYVSAAEDDKKASIRNCCFAEHIESLEMEERRKTFRMVSSGKELWEKRESLYPHLIFCECVRKQLEEARNSLHIKTIMKRLQILEDYFRDFDGKFEKDKMGFGCREESESVKKMKSCGK